MDKYIEIIGKKYLAEEKYFGEWSYNNSMREN